MSEPSVSAQSVVCLRAPNPSPMTLDGTNGYVVYAAADALVAIDPGIDDAAHMQKFLEIAQTARAAYVAILVTHGHPDHYPGALALRRLTHAPVYAHRSAAFAYDRPLDDGRRLRFGSAEIHALHTPGHAGDHLVFWLAARRALFTGDLIVGTGTVVVAPPSGDMRAYQRSLARLLRDYGDADIIYGGHGPAVFTPRAKIREYIAHREERERQLVTALTTAASIPALVDRLYPGLEPALRPAAAGQIAAYLIALEREGRIVARSARGATTQEARLLDPAWGTPAGTVVALPGAMSTRLTVAEQTLYEYALR